MLRKILKIRDKNRKFLVDPDEIFLDSKNLENFDRQQFEGRIEKPIPKKTILFLGIAFFFFAGIFGSSPPHIPPSFSDQKIRACNLKVDAKSFELFQQQLIDYLKVLQES